MARIKYGALVDSISGSIGGTTFQANAYGYTVKRKPNMIRPWTSDQLAMQKAFSLAVKAWKEAASATRVNWETWAGTNPQYSKHNPSSVLTGFACFVKWHVQRFITIGYFVDTAPSLVIPAAPPIALKIIVAAGVMTLDIACDGVEDWNLNFSFSRPFGPSQNFIGTKTRLIDWSTDTDTAKVITTKYAARYGAIPAVGDRVAVDYVRFMESGGEVRTRVQEVITVTAV